MSFSVETNEIRIIDQIEAGGFDPGKTEQLLSADLIILPAEWDLEHQHGSFSLDAADFQKFVRKKYPDIKIAVFGETATAAYLGQRSDDIHLQTLYWASELVRDIIAILIGEYIIHRARGNPRNENQALRLRYYEENQKTGITKRYSFDGPASEFPECTELLMGQNDQVISDERLDE